MDMFLVLRGQCTIMFIQSESKIEISNGTHRCLEHERRLVEPGAVEPATSCISGSRHPPATMDDVSQQCTGKTKIRKDIMAIAYIFVRLPFATIRHLSQCWILNQSKDILYFLLRLFSCNNVLYGIRQQCKTAIRVSTISEKLAASVRYGICVPATINDARQQWESKDYINRMRYEVYLEIYCI